MTLTEFRTLIRNAARTAFTELLANHQSEPFYVFALQTLDDATGVYAAANTEAGYRRCAARFSEDDDFPVERYCRWYWGEWAYTSIRSDLFRGVYDFLNRRDRRFNDSDLASSFEPAVFASMALALRDLDGEGVFGSEREQGRIALLCTVEDSFSTDWVEDESARWLNPPAVYQTFAACRGAEVRQRSVLHADSQRMRDELVHILYSRDNNKEMP
jgi:Domain of unknown function (DUF4303)